MRGFLGSAIITSAFFLAGVAAFASASGLRRFGATTLARRLIGS
jgi:hypothetical protein